MPLKKARKKAEVMVHVVADRRLLAPRTPIQAIASGKVGKG
jgi:hypothetical protein